MRYPQLTLDDWLNLAEAAISRCERPIQCAYESLESRKGACDGGERCRNQATCEDANGIPYCNKHGMN